MEKVGQGSGGGPKPCAVNIDDYFSGTSRHNSNISGACKFCGGKFNGSATRLWSHLQGITGRGIAVCTKIDIAARNAITDAINVKKAITKDAQAKRNLNVS